MVAIVLGSIIFAPLVVPYPPNVMDPSQSLSGPSRSHLFGTDLLGRDLLSRVATGSRSSVSAALLAVMTGAIPGTALGIAGGMGKKRSPLLSRIMDAWMAVPGVLLAVVLGAAFGRSSIMLALALGIAGIPSYFRQARAETLKQRPSEYIMAARSVGASKARIWFRHLLPNILPMTAVLVTLRVGGMLLAISALSFLGLGTQPPNPEWGSMLSEARDFMDQAWWLAVFPGAAIAWTAFGFNLLGDSLRDRLDRMA